MKMSQLLEDTATVLAERGHYMHGRDVFGEGVVCLYQAASIAWLVAEHNVKVGDIDALTDLGAPYVFEMTRWIKDAGAGAQSVGMLVRWSDTTDDETVILTVKRAAELARAAGK